MSERDLKFFHANPPRLFPSDPHQRPKIEGLLAQLAATEPERYKERLEVYNRMCEEKELPLFKRIVVVKEEEKQKPEVAAIEMTVPSDPVIETSTTEAEADPTPEPKKKTKKVKSDSPAA